MTNRARIKGECQRCGTETLLTRLRKEWTGLMVCPDCYDRRHPQDFVRGVKERQSVPNARPEPADVFRDTTDDEAL